MASRRGSKHQQLSRTVVNAANTANDDDMDVEAHQSKLDAMADYRKAFFDKGNISLMVTFSVMCLGLILVMSVDESKVKDITFEKYILSFGLFGFAGGFTNWLAVTMLFVKVPGLIGSGVIPTRYVEIRASVKDVIMGTFFDGDFLEDYLGTKLKEFGGNIDTEKQVKDVLESEDFDKNLDARLEGLKELPSFAPVLAMGMQPAQLKPMIKPFITELALELAPLMKDKMMDPKFIVDINQVRDLIDEYMSVRMQTLTEKKVVRLLSFVIRDHLGWLIVWGNVFGAIIGVIAEAAGINPKYRNY